MVPEKAKAKRAPKSCLYCGNNPTPHFLTWYTSTLDILFAPLRRLLFYNPLALRLAQIIGKIGVGRGLLLLAEKLRIITYTDSIEDCNGDRGRVLWEEALRRGFSLRAFKLFGRTADIYEVRQGSRTVRFIGLPRPIGNDAVLELMDDKWEMKRKLKERGIPVPQGEVITSWRQAKKVFAKLQKPVIVKPRSGSRGRHTTTFINTLEELKKGVKRAQELCHWVIVEEHLEGPVYRGTVINYKLQGLLRGDSPSVLGDGVRTISELVAIKNAEPHPGVADIKIDNGTMLFLARQELTADSVLEAGRKIFLTEKIGVGYGGSSSEDFTICHPDTKQLFEEAARVIGDPIVGFDFIIADITKSYKEQRAGFIEANSVPFINLHHDPLLGEPRNVAAAVWDLMGFPKKAN